MSSDSVSGSKHVADTPAEAAAPDSKKARPAEEEVKPAAEQSGMYTRPGFKPEEHIFHKTNKGCALSYVIIYVTDPERSIKFYEDVFGFELRIKHGKWWSELSAGNTTLALHWVDNSAAKGEEGGAAASAAASKDGPASSSEKPSQAGVASPSFFVEDLDAFHSRVQSIPGLTVVKAPSKQPWGGAQASYKDPDGLTLSVTELKKMRTE